MAMQRDMTVGSPMRMIIEFTIPVFLGNIFQQIYSMVDTIIVGKFVGTKALAAVGSTSTIVFLILGFLSGFTVGVTVITSQRFGAGDMKGMRRTIGSAYILAGIIAFIMTVVSMTGMRSLLVLMNTPEDIFEDAYAYIIVICGGIATTMLYNLLACMLRAIGNSKTPLYFLILSAMLNVVLDFVFILIFKMGTAGAAYATVIAQAVSGICCLVYILKCVPLLRIHRADFKPDAKIVKNQLGVSLPMGFQYSITAIGTMMVQSALNLLGSVYVAGYTAGCKIEQMITQAYVAMGTTMAAYCAQNTGAHKSDRIRKGFRAAVIIGTVYSVITGVFLIFAGKYLTPLFINEDLEAVTEGVDLCLKCAGYFLIPLAFINIFRNGIQGMGYGILPMMAGVTELIARGIVAVISAKYLSYFGVCMADPVAWIFAGALVVVMYFYVAKRADREWNS